MSTVIIELTVDQLLAALQKLPFEDQDYVRRRLGDELWGQRLESLLAEVCERAAQDPNPITEEEILAEVKAVRAERYAKSRR